MFKGLLRLGNNAQNSKVEYIEKDIQHVIESHRKELELELGGPLYITSSGVILKDEITREVKDILKGEGRTTVGLIASEVGLEQPLIRSALSRISDVEIYQTETGIFCEKEVERLKNVLDKHLVSQSGAFDYIPFCTENRIDFDALRFLVQKEVVVPCFINDNLVVSKEAYAQVKKSMINQLETNDSPISLSDLVVDSTANELIWQNLVSSAPQWIRDTPIAGTIDRDNVFTPTRYKDKLQTDLIEELKKNGTGKVSDFAGIGTKDPIKVLRAQGIAAGSLMSTIYTQQYVTSEIEVHQKRLTSAEWTELLYRMPLADEEQFITAVLVPKFSGKVTTVKDRSVTFVFNVSLLNRLKKGIEQHYTQEAGKVTDKVLDDLPLGKSKSSSTITSQIVHGSMAPDEASVQRFLVEFDNAKLDNPELLSYLSKRYVKLAQDSFGEVVKQRVDDFLRERDEKDTMKQVVYFNGADTVKDYDQKLYTALSEELLSKYVHRPTVVYKNQQLDNVRSELVAKLRSQLDKAQDSALVLHLAILIEHSEYFSGRNKTPGLLKASGKYVPKLLKHLTSTAEDKDFNVFLQLKNAVKEGDSQLQGELIKQVKTLVLENGN